MKAYELIENRKIADLNSDAKILRHKKTGARIAILQNEDENKVFYIGFRTPPKDSTGVAHILEHSVLCGSEKYPLKDPFIELAKGSLNTFLNAMTYPDKTVYPVASCNDKDFQNLMSVYLDAVFAPLSILDPKPFLQEGWHLELFNEDELPSYKGITFLLLLFSHYAITLKFQMKFYLLFYYLFSFCKCIFIPTSAGVWQKEIATNKA